MGCMRWLNKMQEKEQGGRAAASVSLLPASPSCLRLLLPCLSPVMDSTLNQGARYVLPSVVLVGYPVSAARKGTNRATLHAAYAI